METNRNSSANSTTSGTPSGTASGASSNANSGSQSFGGLNLDSLKDTLGNLNIPESLKKYSGSATRAISGLSTTQKVVGGALLVLGATYLARNGKAKSWMSNNLGSLNKKMKSNGKNKNKANH